MSGLYIKILIFSRTNRQNGCKGIYFGQEGENNLDKEVEL
jgi:hypothetical protein